MKENVKPMTSLSPLLPLGIDFCVRMDAYGRDLFLQRTRTNSIVHEALRLFSRAIWLTCWLYKISNKTHCDFPEDSVTCLNANTYIYKMVARSLSVANGFPPMESQCHPSWCREQDHSEQFLPFVSANTIVSKLTQVSTQSLVVLPPYTALGCPGSELVVSLS